MANECITSFLVLSLNQRIIYMQRKVHENKLFTHLLQEIQIKCQNIISKLPWLKTEKTFGAFC